MRVVLDTNILARALTGPEGPAAAVLAAIVPPHLLVVSPFLLSELTRVLGYERLRAMHGRDDEGIARFILQIQEEALVVAPPEDALPATVPHDPQDDPILATAIAGQADVLCTLDRHFGHPEVLGFCAAHSLRVMTDVELLAELRAEETTNESPPADPV